MKILAFSDLHLDEDAARAILDAAPEADLVIGAGDFAQRREGLDAYMALLEPIANKAVFVAGNNESVDELRAVSSAVILHGEAGRVDGLTIAGLGCAVPPLPPLPWPSCDITEDQARDLLAPIKHADILISHSPPHGVCDLLAQHGHIGSKSVREAVEHLQPKLVFCGHIHDSWGQEGMIGASRVVNLGPRVNWFEIDPTS
ncbi:MAG: metallophosphoesterase family protein [Maritimibacter sp.]